MSRLFKNFRPIPNLNYISKLIVRVILEQLKNQMSANNLMGTMQSVYIVQKLRYYEFNTYING